MLTAGRHFALCLEEFGDAPAVITADGDRLSYRELAARADDFARALGPARRLLAIEASNEVEPLAAYLGALRAGHAVWLMAPGGGMRAGDLYDRYRPDARYACGDGGWQLDLNPIDPTEIHADLAVLLGTSGTTGSAKLVRLSAGAVDANARSIAQYLRIRPDDRAITSLPMHYSYGLSVVNSHLASGAALLLTDRSVIEPEYRDFFEREGATSQAGVPYTYQLLDGVGFWEKELPTLRVLTQAGGKLPAESAARHARWAAGRGVEFFMMYGQTEATARMGFLPPDLIAAHPDCIGIPIPGGHFRLLDENGQEITGPDAVGELAYRGPNVMMGYALERGDLARPAELEELRTGDLAQRNEAGLYRIVGRKSRFCKLFGLRVNLDEIEAALRREGVEGVATGDDSMVALCFARNSPWERALAKLVDDTGLPREVFETVLLDEPPRLSSGKPDYRTIMAIAEDQRARATQVAGGTNVQAIFARAFRGKSPAPQDSFVSLGGDSLNYVTTSLALEDLLGVLPPNWEETSIADLTALARHPAMPRRRFFRPIDSEIVLRALAILAVVANHATTLTVGGGASVLLLLAGYTMARYYMVWFATGRGGEYLRSFVRRIMLPYYAILLLYFAAKGGGDIPSLLLVSNYFGRFSSLLEPYWFLELLLQCMLIMWVLFSLPPIRRLAGRSSWHFGLALLGMAVAVKIGAQLLVPRPELANRTPETLFYLLALGWCFHEAPGRAGRALIFAVGIGLAAMDMFAPAWLWGSLNYPMSMVHAIWLAIATVLILCLPRIPVPRPLHAAIAAIASAAFYIYLVHGVPVHIFLYVAPFDRLPAEVQGILAIASGVAAGLATRAMIEWWAERRAAKGRDLPVPVEV